MIYICYINHIILFFSAKFLSSILINKLNDPSNDEPIFKIRNAMCSDTISYTVEMMNAYDVMWFERFVSTIDNYNDNLLHYLLLHIGLRYNLVCKNSQYFYNQFTLLPTSFFDSCHNIKELIVPKNIKRVGISTFLNCSGLEKITFGHEILAIGVDTFRGCSNIKETIFANGTIINGDYFYGFKKKLGMENLLFDCPNLKKIIIDNEDFNWNELVTENIDEEEKNITDCIDSQLFNKNIGDHIRIFNPDIILTADNRYRYNNESDLIEYFYPAIFINDHIGKIVDVYYPNFGIIIDGESYEEAFLFATDYLRVFLEFMQENDVSEQLPFHYLDIQNSPENLVILISSVIGRKDYGSKNNKDYLLGHVVCPAIICKLDDGKHKLLFPDLNRTVVDTSIERLFLMARKELGDYILELPRDSDGSIILNGNMLTPLDKVLSNCRDGETAVLIYIIYEYSALDESCITPT